MGLMTLIGDGARREGRPSQSDVRVTRDVSSGKSRPLRPIRGRLRPAGAAWRTWRKGPQLGAKIGRRQTGLREW